MDTRQGAGAGAEEGVCFLVAPDTDAAAAAGDRDLEAVVRVALRRTGYPLRALVVTAAAGRVTLAGRVASFHLKQVAQTITMSLPAVRSVRNALEVSVAVRG